jgi:hypothetical protein
MIIDKPHGNLLVTVRQQYRDLRLIEPVRIAPRSLASLTHLRSWLIESCDISRAQVLGVSRHLSHDYTLRHMTSPWSDITGRDVDALVLFA